MPKRKNAQLTASDRNFIERSLNDAMPVPEIARRLGVAPTTVAREVIRNRVSKSKSFLSVNSRNVCVRRYNCQRTDLCKSGCLVMCRNCKKFICNEKCPEFEPEECPRLHKPPYCCNACHKRYGSGCGYEYGFYDGRMAHEAASMRKTEARRGIDRTEEELLEMARSIKPLLAKGQSPQAIWNAIGDKLPVSHRTFYRYVEQGVFEDILNIDLPKKVKFKVRKRPVKGKERRVDLDGRTYEDFLALPFERQMNAVEMDCVVSARGSSKAILTLLFRRYSFQAMILLPEKSQECVAKALDMIEEAIGTRRFRKWLGVILTDRGSEFLGFDQLEKSARGRKQRCKVYYCDPMKSGQKGRCEKNHVELRKVIPKGTCFSKLDAYKLAIVCSHVNSYSRPSLGGATPFQMAKHSLPKELFDVLGIEEIDSKDVVMSPGLIQL